MKPIKTAFSLVYLALAILLFISSNVWGEQLAEEQTLPQIATQRMPPVGIQEEALQTIQLSGIVTPTTPINVITGAVFDDTTGQLILIGQHDSARPSLKLDDLATALRVIYTGEAPAVSIDPKPGDNTIMDVVYFGGVKNTHLGWVIFEADRLLKIYSMGRDNLTNQEVVSSVPGYKNILDLTVPGQSKTSEPVWYRMWFESVTDEPTQVKVSRNHRAILFNDAQLTVQTEYIPSENSVEPPGSDPAAEAFVQHFNEHFVEFANERPVLYDLVTIQRFLIIARWLRDEGIPKFVVDYGSTGVTAPDGEVSAGTLRLIFERFIRVAGRKDREAKTFHDTFIDAICSPSVISSLTPEQRTTLQQCMIPIPVAPISMNSINQMFPDAA